MLWPKSSVKNTHYTVGPYDRWKWSCGAPINGLNTGQLGYDPYKWSYGPLLMTGRGPTLYIRVHIAVGL